MSRDFEIAVKEHRQNNPYAGNHPAWTGDRCPECGNDTLISGVKAEECKWCGYSEGYW